VNYFEYEQTTIQGWSFGFIFKGSVLQIPYQPFSFLTLYLEERHNRIYLMYHPKKVLRTKELLQTGDNDFMVEQSVRTSILP